MKSIVYNHLELVKNHESDPILKKSLNNSLTLHLNKNILENNFLKQPSQVEVCLFKECNLKCINGHEFCYRHLNGKNNYDNRKYELKKKNFISSILKQSEETKKTVENSDKYLLSEQKFLAEDLNIYKESDSSIDSSICSESASKPIKGKKIDYDFYLSKAGVYSKDEIVKIFKSKLSKLNRLYKKQLSILSDKLIINRKKYFVMKKNENNLFEQKVTPLANSFSHYRKRSSLAMYIKKKYHPMFSNSKFSIYNNSFEQNNNKCAFQSFECFNKTLPLSNYCKEHILNDPNQVLFFGCSQNESESNKCINPVIESIGLKCPIHLANGLVENKLDSSTVKYALSLAKKKSIHLKKYVSTNNSVEANDFSKINETNSITIEESQHLDSESSLQTETLVRIKDELISCIEENSRKLESDHSKTDKQASEITNEKVFF